MQPLSLTKFCSLTTFGTVAVASAITLLFWSYFRNPHSEQETADRDLTIRGSRINVSKITVKGNITAIAEGHGATANVSSAQAPNGSIRAVAIGSGVSPERLAQLDALFRRRR